MKVIVYSDVGLIESEFKFVIFIYYGRKILIFLLVIELLWSIFVGDRSEFFFIDKFWYFRYYYIIVYYKEGGE